jgi:hypothetical protein
MTRRRLSRREVGSVTAELAVAMPVVVLLLVAGLAGVGGVLTKLQCVDTARELARAEARGDAAPNVPVPPGAVVSYQRDGDLVRVVVRARVRWSASLPELVVTAEAVAAMEPTGHGP